MHLAKIPPIRLALIGLVLIVAIFMIGFVAISDSPRDLAKNETIRTAEKNAGLKNPGRFYLYNRKATYYAIEGENKQGDAIDVIVAKKTGNITVLRQSSGLTRNAALKKVWDQEKPSQVLNISLGISNKTPVWEISYLAKNKTLNYLTLDFKTGRVVKLIGNL